MLRKSTLRKYRDVKKTFSRTSSTKGSEPLITGGGTKAVSPATPARQLPLIEFKTITLDPTDFISFMRIACTQYEIEVYLVFDVKYEEWKSGGRDKKERKQRSSLFSSTEIAQARTSDARRASIYRSSRSGDSKIFPPPVKVSLTVNLNDKLQRIDIKEKVPREVVNLIGLIANYHPLLFSFILRGNQDQYVIHEVSKLLPLTNITEIIFDNVNNDHGNFYVVLDNPGMLTCLTITRCHVNDVVVKEIVDRLMYGTPGGKVVKYLNLSCNFITDTGALFIGELLRTNITLCYINISSNQITDAGAAWILDSLKQFEITRDEFECTSKLHTEYLKEKYKVLKQFINEVKVESRRDVKKGKTDLKKSKLSKEDDRIFVLLMQQAELALKYPAFDHPYQGNRQIIKDNIMYCIGNTTLTGLNLGYNSLTHISMTKILDVIKYKMALEDMRYRSMVRICVEGNLLNETSIDLGIIDSYLRENLNRYGKFTSKIRSSSMASNGW